MLMTDYDPETGVINYLHSVGPMKVISNGDVETRKRYQVVYGPGTGVQPDGSIYTFSPYLTAPKFNTLKMVIHI